jgi:hypothetical protein
MAANGMAEQPANKGTAAPNKVAPKGLVALYDSEEEDRGKATNKAHYEVSLHSSSQIIEFWDF